MPSAGCWVLCAVLGALVFGAGCAARSAPGPVAPGVARHPDFAFPDIPNELSSPSLDARHQAAWNVLQAGDPRRAEREFTALAATNFYPAAAGLGYTHLARKDFAAAVAAFDRALAASPAYVPALLGKGEALMGQNEQALALAVFEKAIAANPAMTPVRARVDVLRFRAVQEQVERAQAAARAGRLDEAEAAYERAITASPESGFLYRELAAVEQQRGNFDEALAHARRAIDLDKADGAAHAIAGAVLEGRGDFAGAAAAFEAAAAIDQSAAYRARAAELRRKAGEALLPEEFRGIPAAPSINRAQLAALIGRSLERLVATAPQRPPVVMTDVRGHWANTWIHAVTRARVMDAFPNHTFQPGGVVRRGDFAQAVSRLLTAIGARRPDLAITWRTARPAFTDVSPSHLAYPAAAMAITSGVMTAPGGAFELTRPITGQDAIDALARLQALIR
ncbi:MAG: tetratricopeptide repeat protein [Acidobacteriota bacterium]|nr:tetratricopeptide repeat protein [Acidobacteriota bacterium]